MPESRFIQVILPLRLEWEPFYRMEAPVAPGERVEVPFSGRHYIGVVSAVGVTPPEDMRVLEARPTRLPPISQEELRFWKVLSDYYLCTIGEVYKNAYPSVKTEGETLLVHRHERLEKRLERLRQQAEKAKSEKTRTRYQEEAGRIQQLLANPNPTEVPVLQEIALSESQGNALQEIQEAFSQKKTALLCGPAQPELYLALAREVLLSGKSVLILVPEIALAKPLEERIAGVFPDVLTYHGALSAGRKRGVASLLRQTDQALVLGTRSALMLPFRKLGLVIVDQEHDSSYKQDSPAPRYHARESAIMLSVLHGARVLLSSATPSLESLYNAEAGLFARIDLKQSSTIGEAPEIRVVNTLAEVRKRGMSGSFSLKLLEEMHACLEQGKKILLVCRSRQALQECEEELRGILPEESRGSIVTATPASVKNLPGTPFALIGIVLADHLLSKEDFRSDERTLQFLRGLEGRCAPGGLLIIQSREAGHPVFKALQEGLEASLFLEERRVAAYPPYTRLVDLVFHDKSEKRIQFLSQQLAEALRAEGLSPLGPYQPQGLPESGEKARIIRISLFKDKQLQARKRRLYQRVGAFEEQYKYQGHILFDVDPV